MKLGMSRAWAYQQAKVAIEGVKAIKEQRQKNAAKERRNRVQHARQSAQESDFDPTSAWTDEEIEAEMGE